MIGRTKVLVDSEYSSTLGEYKSLYCDTLGSIRDLVVSGGLDNIPGVESVSLLLDGPAPDVCELDLPDFVDDFPLDKIIPGGETSPEDTAEKETDTSEKSNGAFKLVFLGFVGMASGMIVVGFLIFAWRSKRNVNREREVESAESSPSSRSCLSEQSMIEPVEIDDNPYIDEEIP